MLISELTEDQKDYLAWRLEHKVGEHPVIAFKLARGDLGSMTVKEAFVFCDCNEKSSAMQATKVERYNRSEHLKGMK